MAITSVRPDLATRLRTVVVRTHRRLRQEGGGRLSPTPSAALHRTFSSLSVPNYRRYFAGQVVSVSGNWMQRVAEMWLIVQLTGSGVSVGVTAGLQFLPVLFLGAWGGLVADRFDKRRLLMV